MKTQLGILFAVVGALITASPAFAVPAKPVDATVVTLLPADGTPESLRKMTASFSAAIAKANKDANAKRSQLRQHLVEGFDRAVTQAQTAGDLDTVLAIKDAKEKLDSLEDSDIPLIKNAIAFREKKTAEIEAARISDALKAAKDFNDELEKSKKSETQKGNLDTAMAFSNQQKKVLEWVANLRKSEQTPHPVNANSFGTRREQSDLAEETRTSMSEEKPGAAPGNGVKRIDLGNGISIEMVHCPDVGSNFWIGKYEVTQEQWFQIMRSNPSTHKHPKNPVETVTWAACNEFVKKINTSPVSKTTGFVFRLPNSSEWETACKAGSTSGGYCRLVDGTEISATTLVRVARYGNGDQGPTNVGSLEPNAWGLYDMIGNVWEWTQDEDNRGRHRRKGGCWYDEIDRCNAHSFWWTPSSRSYAAVGFRIAATNSSP